ncbi:hypothetical protein HDV00_007439 [Rhizophlyctis rosea]|nr:hypothetical protein HDV00_007439 [Rhizophlyctis rosea]
MTINASPEKVVIRQGRIGLSFHLVAGEVFQYVLERLGYSVEVEVAPHEAMFGKQKDGEIDILLGWLEGSHGKYLDQYRDEAVVLKNAVYEPYCIWGVPDYVPASVVSCIDDLKKPEVVEKMIKKVQGINMGAGISRFSVEMIEAYGLAEHGYHFTPGTQDDCFDAFEQAVQNEEWIVIPLWHPQFLHHTYSIRALQEPLSLLRGVDTCQPIIHSASLSKFHPDHIKILSNITLGNSSVTEMDYYTNRLNMSPKRAALKWISQNKARVESWFESTPYDRLAALGLTLPPAPRAVGSYEAYTITSAGLISTSLQLPWVDGVLAVSGKVGNVPNSTEDPQDPLKVVCVDEAIKAARICALNLLAQLHEASGGNLTRVKMVRLEGNVTSDKGFLRSPEVLNAASELLLDVLGKNGKHARTALHHVEAPLNVPVLLGAQAELLW